MNTTIHPSQWFHYHKSQAPAERGKVWRLVHSESLWIITAMLVVFAVLIVLTLVFGNPPVQPLDFPSGVPFPY